MLITRGAVGLSCW